MSIMRFVSVPCVLVCSSVLLGIAAIPAPVQAAALGVDYSISLMGLPLGNADLAASFTNGRYDMRMNARLTGLVGMITSGKGSGTASGQLGTMRPLPSAFAVNSRNSTDQRVVRMGLTGGNVAAVEIDPPLDAKQDRVPVGQEHKRAVMDPMSALLMPIATKNGPLDPANCNRTLPIFDGAARFDIVLSYAGTREFKKPGFDGQALVCNARYVPIAGHRAKRPAVKFMQENRDMSVWLAPLGGPQLLVPLRVSVKTMIGTSVVEATKIKVDQDATSATLGKTR
jgi:hypothetical protein